ncbi:hypothetical protein LO762_23620 [Actinocorallia sp. API 0066]|uniref:hypothetical protein n=1 Tax=Actinocorallia sp. API 0066 TaxID=2896846 RepID=UPI001E5CB0A6|nr:hypothetical protein [Actinocorallia sp. API 0066]MCD0452158.1 hypothetical protein [Actinocorallia sp. API 0066]
MKGLGLPGVAERVPVLAYGANRNPATLHVKMGDYRYRAPFGRDVCLPVLRATLADAEVVACGLHGQGYLYGELLLDSPHADGVVLEARVCLADADQLRVLNDSEGIREGHYRLVRVPGVRVEAAGVEISAVAYAADAHVWVSPVHESPLGFDTVPALGRRVPSLNATEGLDHVITVLGLREDVCRWTGLDDTGSLAAELAKYLNGQWWYARHTGREPIAGYGRVLGAVREGMAGRTLRSRTFDSLAERGLVIGDAYAPEPLGGVLLP